MLSTDFETDKWMKTDLVACGEDFTGEPVRVVKEKEVRLYGEYRTQRLVLEAWDGLNKNRSIKWRAK